MLDERLDAGALARRQREDVVGDAELGGGLQRRQRVGLVEAVDLVDDDRDRHVGARQGAGDEAVARADALLAVDEQQRRVGLAELALDARLHALRQRVARALHAGQVDEHELRAAAHRDPADRAARRLRLVGDDRDLLADDRVDERRLADVRAAGERDEAGARGRRSASPGGHRHGPSSGVTQARISRCTASISPSSVSWSMPVRCSAPWTIASRRSAGVLGADDDVAELARAGRGVLAVDREREHVGRAVLAAVLGVELGDPLGADELDGDVAAVDPRRARARATAAGRSPPAAGRPARPGRPKTSISRSWLKRGGGPRAAARRSGSRRARRRPRRSSARAGGARRPRRRSGRSRCPRCP